MTEVTIRLHFQQADGAIADGQQDFSLSDFAGVIPTIGDEILDPATSQGANRVDPKNRRMWTVVGRVFNPRDLSDYVALIVTERALTKKDEPFLG